MLDGLRGEDSISAICRREDRGEPVLLPHGTLRHVATICVLSLRRSFPRDASIALPHFTPQTPKASGGRLYVFVFVVIFWLRGLATNDSCA